MALKTSFCEKYKFCSIPSKLFQRFSETTWCIIDWSALNEHGRQKVHQIPWQFFFILIYFWGPHLYKCFLQALFIQSARLDCGDLLFWISGRSIFTDNNLQFVGSKMTFWWQWPMFCWAGYCLASLKKLSLSSEREFEVVFTLERFNIIYIQKLYWSCCFFLN